jgi:hypothetical protein
MSMKFPYKSIKLQKPAWTLRGRHDRPRPLLTAALIGPSTGSSIPQQGLLDTGSDDTVFSELLASLIGVDLTHAPIGEASGIGGGTAILRYAEVVLRLSDGREHREWTARVGFTSAPLRRPLFGFAGFLQFFTASFHGDREEVELTINRLYQGT